MASNPTPHPPRHKTPESFASFQKRNFAAEVLSSYEKLSWYSYQRCESMLQTRLHFQNIVCGLEHLEDALVDWQTDYTPHPSSASSSSTLSTKKKKSRTGEEGEAGSRKGKDRTGDGGSSRSPRKEGR